MTAGSGTSDASGMIAGMADHVSAPVALEVDLERKARSSSISFCLVAAVGDCMFNRDASSFSSVKEHDSRSLFSSSV